MWAVEAVRKRVQNQLSLKLRKYFKHSKRFILKRFNLLDEDLKSALQVMFSYNSELAIAHTLKEKLLKITASASSSTEARVLLKEWIKLAQNSSIKEFHKCADTYIRYFDGIANSFDIPYINACTEGFNNKIKVIKRNAFGYKIFIDLEIEYFIDVIKYYKILDFREPTTVGLFVMQIFKQTSPKPIYLSKILIKQERTGILNEYPPQLLTKSQIKKQIWQHSISPIPHWFSTISPAELNRPGSEYVRVLQGLLNVLEDK